MATRLPADVKRYLALTKDMSLRKILDLCRLNKEYNRDICNNLAFWQALAQQRYGYTREQARGMNVQQLKAAAKEYETAYTSEEGIRLIGRVTWTVGSNALENIRLYDRNKRYEDTNFTNPDIQAMMLKKINFGRSLIIYVEDFSDFVPDQDPNGKLALELPGLISPMEIIGELAAYYEEEKQRLGLQITGELMNNHIFFGGLHPYQDGYAVVNN